LQNIEWLEAAKKQLHSHTPHIIWYYLVHKFNEHEIPQAKEMARKLGLSIAFELLCTWDETWDSSYHHTGYVPRYFKGTDLTEYHLADRSLPIKVDQIKLHPALGECLCRQLFTTMVISWNGTVFPCSTANSDDFSLGNILTVDLVELWNNAGYRRCREYLYHYNQKQHIETVCNNNVCALKTRKVLC
jgi:radical SAM protein with 4Fe4S-binding SPASM domain